MFEGVIGKQRAFFFTHQTKELDFRVEQLKRLRRAILAYEERFYEALWKDLHKSRFEAYATEIGLVLEEISLHIRKLKRWAKPVRVGTNQLVHLWSSSRIIREPYGLVLIMSPWNYPFQLLLNPLVGAISAGNCAVLKPSEYVPNTAEVMRAMITEYFSEDYIALFTGGLEVNQALLSQQWDYIFFTGSPMVGRVVMEAAAKHLTPVSLELGGKSPCIVDADADLKSAASRIAWGKFINAGQTCIAPDYLFVHKSVSAAFLPMLKEKIISYYGENPETSPDFVRIATVPKTERLVNFINSGEVFFGGVVKVPEKYISPTILVNVKPTDPIMQEEIFGPVLPVMEFDQIAEVIKFINSRPKPLAFYYFSSSRKKQRDVLRQTSSGGGCINEVVMHIGNSKMPFGGVGDSGIGNYHGKYSFQTFSHARAILKKTTLFDVPLRYPPYGNKLKIVKMVMK